MDQNPEPSLNALKKLNLYKLRYEFKKRIGSDPPPVRSADYLCRLLAWKIQEKACGGLSAPTKRRLKRLGAAFANNPDHAPTPTFSHKPGTILVREWGGTSHRVRVDKTGFEYNGSHFDSLSEVARHITGTRWSGPLFFGLKNGKGK